MARSGQYNPFGQTPYDGVRRSSSDDAFGVVNAATEKWIVAGLLGLFGGSLGYFIYKKRLRNNNNSSRLTTPGRQQPNRNLNAEFACIKDLPAEIRTRIWQALPYEDRLSLRLTSQFTKDDVDALVGLNGRITTADSEKYDFYQRIALSSCWITELQQPIDQDFLLNPTVLQTLDIREHAPIPLQNIQTILGMTTNLRRLKLRLILNDNTKGISETLLETIPHMKDLRFLHVRTIMRYVNETKNYAGAEASSHSYSFSTPKYLKTVHLEMPDLPEEEVAKWKKIIDKQICVENLTVNLGNLSWHFFEQVLGQNSSTIEKLVLEGLRGWDYQRELEDPLDWTIFADFNNLKSVDLSCNRGGEHDVLPTVNFQLFPCTAIEEFFISRIIIAPEAVERVYNDMGSLQRGALDHIGNLGIERANEMAWLIRQGEEENLSWWQDERFWEMAAHTFFGLSLALVLTFVIRARGVGTGSLVGTAVNSYNKAVAGESISIGNQNSP